MSSRRAAAWVQVLALLILTLSPLGGGSGALAAAPPHAAATAAASGQPQPPVTNAIDGQRQSTVPGAAYGQPQPQPRAAAPAVRGQPMAAVAAAVYGQPALNIATAAPDVVAGVAVGVAGTLRDSSGDPIPNATVALSASVGAVRPETVTTDVYGQFSAVFDAPATASGLAVLTATSATAVGTATFAVTSGPAPAVSLDLAQAVTMAGGAVAVSGSVYRGDGTPAGGVAVDLSASAGTPAAATALTEAGGAYMFTLTPPSVPGPVLLQVSAPGLGVAATGVLVVAAAAPTGASAAFSLGGGGVVAGGAGTPAPDVAVTASGGTGAVALVEYGSHVPPGASALPGATLYFTAGVSAGSSFTSLVLQGCGAGAGAGSGASLSWWSDGGWTAVTPAGQVGGCLEAGPFAADGGTSPAVADFGAGPLFAIGGAGGVSSAGAVDPAQSSVSATPTSVPDDGVSAATVSVTLLDSQGDPVSGKTVTLSQDAGASSVIATAGGASNSSGVVTFSVSDAVAETVTYTATDTTDGITLPQTASVTFAPASQSGVQAVDAAQSTVYASPSSVPDDGATPATIDVTLLDGQGDPVGGKTVTLSQDAGASSAISPVAGVTDSSGIVVFTVTDATPETVTYTATDTTDGITLPQTATVAFAPAVTSSAGTPVVASISPTSGPAAGGTTVTISGSGFTGAYTVYFGDVAATSFNPISDSEVTAVSPAGTAGDTVDVTIATDSGTSAVVTSDEFTYGTALATGGTTVTASGGTLASGDGAFSMAVPAGALAAGQTLALTESCAAPSGVPAGFAPASCLFTLSGGTLASPQTATIAYQAAALAGLPANRVSVYAQTAAGGWSFLPTAVDGTAGTAAADLSGPGTYLALAATTTFTDVGLTYWAATDIDTLLAAGIASGYPGGTFDPTGALTRAEFVKMLALTLRLPTATAAPDFADVPASSWFAPFVAEAATAGLVKGVSASEFDPNAPLTRQDAAVALARAMQLTGGATLTFSDAGRVAPWARAAVEAAVSAGYLTGFPGGTLRPLQAMTRGQAAKVLAAVIRHDAP